MVTRRRKVNTDNNLEASEGTSITIQWGEEMFSPVQYNSFRVGGNSITLVVKPGESIQDTYSRGWQILEELADSQFEDKLSGFSARLSETKGR